MFQTPAQDLGFKLVNAGHVFLTRGLALLQGGEIQPGESETIDLLTKFVPDTDGSIVVDFSADLLTPEPEAVPAPPKTGKNKPLSEVDVAMPEGVEIVPLDPGWHRPNDPFRRFTPSGVAQWFAYYNAGLTDRQIAKAMNITESASFQRRKKVEAAQGLTKPKKDEPEDE